MTDMTDMTDMTETGTGTVRPQVNLNGTSREGLIDQVRAVLLTIQTLEAAMQAAWPHGRDYQGVDIERYRSAQEAAIARLRLLEEISSAYHRDARWLMDEG